MSECYTGQIIMGGFKTIPQGFAACDGQLLKIQYNQALFALLGTRYGGDGKTTFALPDLRGRAPIGSSKNYPTGAVGGRESVTLTTDNLPSHTHTVRATTTVADTRLPGYAAQIPADEGALYATASGARATLSRDTSTPTGDGFPLNNMQPFCTLQFLICITGVFPAKP